MDMISHIRLRDVVVSSKTRWLFLEVHSQSGLVGFGEASLQGREALVRQAGDRFGPSLSGMAAKPLDRVWQCETLAEAAFLSALDQALHDIDARRNGMRLADRLGRTRRERIPLYANINRRTIDRSPSGFAASARLALAAGFRAIKLAPFDEVADDARRQGRVAEAMRPGLRRVAAVAEIAGDTSELMVDCHWRFDEASAFRLVDAAREFGVRWLECPLPETEETIPAIRRLRSASNEAGMRLAGCEELVGVQQNRVFAEAGAYDVMMPDVKYAGGVAEMMRLADLFERCGVAFSPHNPSGPISHAASLHVSAVVRSFDRLEVQFDESDLFWTLAGSELPRFEGGSSPLPDGPGLGVTLTTDSTATSRGVAAEWSLSQVTP
ncbi:MAG: mandelate racemase/muconate lactonizing enzyme family protein [Rhizobiales bacterium]|nr:mandelate racemase/muconate lactonizing enzyme family protein [Hyphomicrobiales bacterium]